MNERYLQWLNLKKLCSAAAAADASCRESVMQILTRRGGQVFRAMVIDYAAEAAAADESAAAAAP